MPKASAQSKHHANRTLARQRGLAWARAWRDRNKHAFDALFGDTCPRCGAPMRMDCTQ
jgi:hypothetical protein